jgi:hypothetical protein
MASTITQLIELKNYADSLTSQWVVFNTMLDNILVSLPYYGPQYHVEDYFENNC